MNAPVKVCCKGCMFFQVDPKSPAPAIAGMCRRYPPHCQIVTRVNPLNRSVTEMTTAVVLPAVEGDGDWCGEFQPEPAALNLPGGSISVSLSAPDPIAGGKEDRQVAGGKVKA